MSRNNHDQENKLEQDLEHTKPYTYLKRLIASQRSGLNENDEVKSAGEGQQASDPQSSDAKIRRQDVQDQHSSGITAAIRGVQAASAIKALTRNADSSEGQGQLSQNIRAIRAAVRGKETPLTQTSEDPTFTGAPEGDLHSLNVSSHVTSESVKDVLSADVPMQAGPVDEDLKISTDGGRENSSASHHTIEMDEFDSADPSITKSFNRNSFADHIESDMDYATKNYPGLSSRVESEVLYDTLRETTEDRSQAGMMNDSVIQLYNEANAEELENRSAVGNMGNQDVRDARSVPKAPQTVKSKKPAQNAKDPKGGQGAQGGGKKRKKKKLPIVLLIILRMIRILLVPALCIAALYAGLRIGYVHLGEQNPEDIFDVRTWKHLFDLIFADG